MQNLLPTVQRLRLCTTRSRPATPTPAVHSAHGQAPGCRKTLRLPLVQTVSARCPTTFRPTLVQLSRQWSSIRTQAALRSKRSFWTKAAHRSPQLLLPVEILPAAARMPISPPAHRLVPQATSSCMQNLLPMVQRLQLCITPFPPRTPTPAVHSAHGPVPGNRLTLRLLLVQMVSARQLITFRPM